MASKIGMSFRNEMAQNRIDAALVKIGEKNIVTLPGLPPFTRDPVLADTLQREWLAEALETIAEIKPEAQPMIPVAAPEGSTSHDQLEVNDPTEQKVVEKMVRRSRRPKA